MSALAISAEGVTKTYTIRHERRERYATLRDTLSNAVASLGTRLVGRGGRTDGETELLYALRDVSFEVEPGDRLGIVGRNGAGKSTLLKILSRITEPSAGRVAIAGRLASLLEVGTGFHPELTGRENIFLNGAILGMSRKEIRRKFDEIVAFAEIERFLDTPVKRYSSGMYVRLAFAVAAHLEPDILVVDEVLAVGDGQFQRKCIGKMEDVGREGRTVVFVSHNMAALHRLCNRGICLSQGRLVYSGTAAETVQHYMSLGYAAASLGGLVVADEELEVSRFEIVDAAGAASASFSAVDDVFVEVRFRAPRPLPGLRVGIDVASMNDGEVLFRTFDDDVVERAREPGSFHARCRIPGNLLLPGSYLVFLQVGVHNVRWISAGDVVRKFSVEHLEGVNARYADSRPGRIMPLIQWQEQREDGA